MGSMSIWHWLIVLVIIMLVFGTKKLRNIGQDLGGAVKGFKEGVREGEQGATTTTTVNGPATTQKASVDGTRTIDVDAKEKL